MTEDFTRRSHGHRRRTRSVGSIPSSWQQKSRELNAQSDEMESNNTIHFQTDSDDQYDTHSSLSHTENVNVMESDSFGGNMASRVFVRRKRKFRKIAMDIDTDNTAHWRMQIPALNKRRKRTFSKFAFVGYNVKSGKRKRASADKNGAPGKEMDQESKVLAFSKLSLNDGKEQNGVMMDTISHGSSSPISSSESEIGICTDDRGLEGDDEQSDWVNDVTISNMRRNDDPRLRANSMSYNFGAMLNETKKCKEGDIRGSKRRVRKANVDFLMQPAETLSECSPSPMDLDLNYKKPDQPTAGTSRRHTFSGLKKRKRIPTMIFEPVTDKTGSFVAKGLSDISSSDPRDIM